MKLTPSNYDDATLSCKCYPIPRYSCPHHKPVCSSLIIVLILQDLEGKIVVDELRQEVLSTNSKAQAPQCISLAWSADGQTLFAGYTDNLIRVWQVSMAAR